MHCFEKLWKESANIEILNLSKQKEEETIWCQNKIIILKKIFSENLLSIETKKKTDTQKQACLFWTFNTRIK